MQTAATPTRVMGLYDAPFWQFLDETGAMHLQCCAECATWRYPPGPVCQACLSPRHDWRAVSGGGVLLSWIVFHKQYLPEYPAPYNVAAVRLEEGPTMISNLAEDPQTLDLIGRRVRLEVVRMNDSVALPRFALAD